MSSLSAGGGGVVPRLRSLSFSKLKSYTPRDAGAAPAAFQLASATGNDRNRKPDAQDPPRGQILARSRRGNKKLADWFQRRVRSGPGRNFLLFAVPHPLERWLQSAGTTSIGPGSNRSRNEHVAWSGSRAAPSLPEALRARAHRHP